MFRSLPWVGMLFLTGASALQADGTGPFSASVPIPQADIWMYPHGSSGGTRTSASTYTALPTPASETGVEDRFAQFVLKFNTAAVGIRPGLGAENYDPSRVVLTAVIVSAGTPYDPTEDARTSHLSGGTPDSDAGRAIEVHGTGFRNGVTDATFSESSSFGSGVIHGRSAYAMGFSPEGAARDVSHNVTEGFDSIPWAVGRVLTSYDDGETYEPLTTGAAISYLDHVEFKLNLALPGVAAYVRESLNKGYLWLTVSSLHSTTQQAFTGYPAFFTKENAEQAEFGDVAASLQVDYSLPVKVLAFSRDVPAGTASITWNGSPGFKYELQRSESLTTGSWSLVDTRQPTTANPLSWNGQSSSQRAFFRVVRTTLPQP